MFRRGSRGELFAVAHSRFSGMSKSMPDDYSDSLMLSSLLTANFALRFGLAARLDKSSRSQPGLIVAEAGVLFVAILLI